MIDFRNRLAARTETKITEPCRLYETLDRKSVAGPLRSAQEIILKDWYNNRLNDRDVVIKMHTGEGKTLIGLLILQSMINADKGPCLYICPNIFLFKQVCAEARKFGIPFCLIDDDNSFPDEFLSGKKLLITHAHKVFNGKSIFGVGNTFIQVGTVVLDDAHACIDVIKNQQTAIIKKVESETLYRKLFSIFEDDIRAQGEGTYFDIVNNKSDAFAPVPYWNWQDKSSEVLRILSESVNNYAEGSGNLSLQFVWPLMRDRIREYCCFISNSSIEISPYVANVNLFKTFATASHRVLMSATTQEDAFFIKSLSFAAEAVHHPLQYSAQKWSGEKMVLIPSLFADECTREWVVPAFLRERRREYGVVALTPNQRKMELYHDDSAICASADNIEECVEKLKNRGFDQLLAICNRYDGIDLPDEACRVLLLDSLPGFSRMSDRYEQACRPMSNLISKKIAQRIEQGIGRGVRGEKDFCAIILIGADLVKFARSISTRKYLSSQTRKQIEIGLELVEMVKEDDVRRDAPLKPMEHVFSLIDQMLQREASWKEYYVEQMQSIAEDEKDISLYERLSTEAEIEKHYAAQEYERAAAKMQSLIDENGFDSEEKGWYLQQLARYCYPIAKEKSLEIQTAAFRNNMQVLKPRTGVEYTKATYISDQRVKRIRKFLQKYKSPGELKLDVDMLLENLSFGVESDSFEESLHKIGELLGFESQRPDHETGKGPDVLWCGPGPQYCIFECKDEVLESRNEISKDEASQTNTHCGWFRNQYGEQAAFDCYMVIPTKVLSSKADFVSPNIRIIRKGKLNLLKKAIVSFVGGVIKYEANDISEETIQKQINANRLNLNDLRDEYSEAFTQFKEGTV